MYYSDQEKKQKISINQVSDTINLWLNNDNLNKHFNIEDAWDVLYDSDKGEGKISFKKNAYIRHLVDDKKYFRLNRELLKIGFKMKEKKDIRDCYPDLSRDLI